ncbi:MAG: tannase/feruloyl esterase family alpha/beta hydrolase [Alphaproteobacteria bacterium]|nr:tannase/feruloyl esterase family alpha/beta hydrolase [Alphaproteobacteria bacterium]
MSHPFPWSACAAAACLVSGFCSTPVMADACSDLAAAKLDKGHVTAATSIPAGQFTTPAQIGYDSQTFDVPAFCRVQLKIGTATAEVWLPFAWNGKLTGWGNGGELGAIIYGEMYFGLIGGYVSVASDLGHQSAGNDASWAFNRPRVIREFGVTATHDMTVAAKALAQTYYGSGPLHAYFIGGSAGGRQALMEAERFPTDYDGIASLYPALGWTHLMSGFIAQELKLGGSADGAGQLSYEQTLSLNKAVLNACDGNDGLRDGLIEDPTRCKFDPGVMACAATHYRAACFTDAQVAATRALYEPLRLSSGKIVYRGLAYGSEYEWSCSVLHDAFNFPFANAWFQNEVYTPGWDFHTFNPDVDVPYADELRAHTLNGDSPNLDAFKAAGGKLVIAQGQSDAVVIPENAIDFYRHVRNRYGKGTEAFARLFMMPGAGHCAKAVGPSSWDIFGVLENWAGSGVAPDSILAYQFNDDGSVNRTRPLCPWPKQARYDGHGDVNDARSFTCK